MRRGWRRLEIWREEDSSVPGCFGVAVRVRAACGGYMKRSETAMDRGVVSMLFVDKEQLVCPLA